jgi:hypothetical protein
MSTQLNIAAPSSRRPRRSEAAKVHEPRALWCVDIRRLALGSNLGGRLGLTKPCVVCGELASEVGHYRGRRRFVHRLVFVLNSHNDPLCITDERCIESPAAED